MKKIAVLFMLLINMIGLAACVKDSTKTFNTSAEVKTNIDMELDKAEKSINPKDNDNGKKIHEDIESGNIRHVNICGNARSIVIKQSASKYFEFYNADLNIDHKYQVHCDENGDTLAIDIEMENAEADNNILGSVIISIPQKEFEKVETTGDFSQIYVYTINSDVLIHSNNSFVNLDLEVDCLDHNITLDGSKSDAFRGVSVYLDKEPKNVRMDLNLIQGGIINDPQSILKKYGFENGSDKPAISINNTKEINVYIKE